MKNPDDDDAPEPPGGRAAERLREFIQQRYPGGLPPGQDPLTNVPDEGTETPAEDPEQEEDYTGL